MTPRIGVKGWTEIRGSGPEVGRRGIGEMEGGVVWPRITSIKDVRAANSARDKFPSAIYVHDRWILSPLPFLPLHLRSLISPQTRSLCTRNWHNVASSCFLSNPMMVLWSSFWIKIIYTRLRERCKRWNTLTTFRGFWGGEIGLLEGIWTGDS